MKRTFGWLAALLLLTACATPAVYDPMDDEGARATGRVEALAATLPPTDRLKLRLIFVHGVGDHCRGYALDRKTGWLNDKDARAMGFTPEDESTAPVWQTIPARVFIKNAQDDSRSYVQFEKRGLSLRLSGRAGAVPVEAIEITWSHTTQWLKSNYLGYDSPSVTPRAPATAPCVEAEPESVAAIKRPPPRLLLDRLIKEQVFDRNLADAVIYTGSYGETMERGVAEALCHALSETPAEQGCDWGSTDISASPDTRYLFITHSLGSRIVYDTILDLIGSSSPGRANKFKPEEWQPAQPHVTQMLLRTPAFYMLANQLSLLGLGNAPVNGRSDAPLQPLDVDASGRVMSVGAAPPAAAARQPLPTYQPCVSPLTALAEQRSRQLSMAGAAAIGVAPTLRFVAFNDTNDLLTWHIPRWYVQPSDGCRPDMEVANVFVRNAIPWFVAEDPRAAHENYFRNRDVWQAITCGANDGRLNAC